MRAVIYARISDDREGLAAGVDRQVQDARTLCAQRGWEVVAVEVDNDLSASRYATKPRPAYLNVLGMAERGEVDVIACYDVDRLYRQPKELEHLIDLAERVTIASVQGDLHLDTSDGRAIARMLAAMAAKSSDDTSRRIKRKHLETARQGMPSIGRRRPFGFERDAITVREVEAVRIREATARILGGDSLTAICSDWTEAGVTTPDGNQWMTTALRRMLTSPRMAGLRAIGGEVVGPAVWDAILDKESHEALCRILSTRAWPGGTNPSARAYLLSGFLVCGVCGTKMTAAPQHAAGGYRYRRYACRKSRGGCGTVGISADGAERTVATDLLDGLVEHGRFQIGATFDLGNELHRAHAAAVAELADIEKRLENKEWDLDEFQAARRPVKARLTSIEQQMARLPARTLAHDLSTSADPSGMWDALSFDRKRSVLVDLLELVTVDPQGEATGFRPTRLHAVWRKP